MRVAYDASAGGVVNLRMSNAAETARSKMIPIRMPLDLLQKVESLQQPGQTRTEVITRALRSAFKMPADERILPPRAKRNAGSVKRFGAVEVVEATPRAVEPPLKPPSGDWWDRRQR